jgi:SulP family sulfate permease
VSTAGTDRGRLGLGRPSLRDLFAGFINAVVSVPDGLACGGLAGVNPVYGLYTSAFAPTAGGLLQSSQLMQIATTSASAIAAAQAIAPYSGAAREQALVLLVLLIGTFLALFGAFRAGRLIRFVSHAVMTGFLIGVAVVLILDQLAPLLGLHPGPGNKVVQAGELLAGLGGASLPTVAVGLATILIVVVLTRTLAARWSSIIALALPTIAVTAWGTGAVATVADENVIPPGLPPLHLPDLRLASFDLIFSAFAIAVIVAIQGAGVSQSLKNPDGRPISASRDMIAQGAANVAAGLFSGVPAGGSVGQTALNLTVGARSRWAAILHGAWMLVFLLLIGNVVGAVPMAALAALMILAGIAAIDWREARSIWDLGGPARWVIVVTFGATLVASIPAAVGAGVLLTVTFHLLSSAREVRIRALKYEGEKAIEVDAPPVLASDAVTVLNVYGSLFFAGARTLADKLPSPAGTRSPAVILRLRGQESVGATLIEVLDEYADRLAKVGGRLYLSGIGKTADEQLRRSGKLAIETDVHLVLQEAELGASTAKAVALAGEWLGSAADPPMMRES